MVKLLHQDQRFSLKDLESIENEVDEMVKFEHALSQKMRSKGSAAIQPLTLGTIHKLRRQERGLAKFLCYYISLCNKLA